MDCLPSVILRKNLFTKLNIITNVFPKIKKVWGFMISLFFTIILRNENIIFIIKIIKCENNITAINIANVDAQKFVKTLKKIILIKKVSQNCHLFNPLY